MASIVRDAPQVVSDKWTAPRNLKNNTRKTSGTCVLAQLCHSLRNQKLCFVVSSASRKRGAPLGGTAGSTPARKLQGTCSEAAGPGRREHVRRPQAAATEPPALPTPAQPPIRCFPGLRVHQGQCAHAASVHRNREYGPGDTHCCPWSREGPPSRPRAEKPYSGV